MFKQRHFQFTGAFWIAAIQLKSRIQFSKERVHQG